MCEYASVHMCVWMCVYMCVCGNIFEPQGRALPFTSRLINKQDSKF